MGRPWRGSEAIAASILEELGFKVLEFHKPVTVGGVDVSDIDIVAEKDGYKYAVEVKAGQADVNAVRQVYVNAELSGMKPLLIARGADEKAIHTAERLGVELLVLPDILIAGVDELREIVYEAVWDAIASITTIPGRCSELEERDLEILHAVASKPTIHDAAQEAGVSVEDVVRVLDKLRKMGFIPKPRKYMVMRSLASLVIALCRGGSFGSS